MWSCCKGRILICVFPVFLFMLVGAFCIERRNMMSGKLLTTSVLCALLTGANMISGGVNAESVYELTPVVVTATKTAESAEKVPASVSVVASAMAKGTFRSLASVWARSVLPEPVGPSIRMLLF